jgi:hypothetical protein
MNLKKNYASLGLALALLAFAPTSSSAYTVTLDGNTATGVLDLFVPGLDTNNATFLQTTPTDIYGSPASPIFQSANEGQAEFAIGFLDDALNSLGEPRDPITDTVGTSSDPANSADTYFVGVDVVRDGTVSILTRDRINGLSDVWTLQSQSEPIEYGEVRIFSDFQVVPVPEPGTALLMGLGLAGFVQVANVMPPDGCSTYARLHAPNPTSLSPIRRAVEAVTEHQESL